MPESPPLLRPIPRRTFDLGPSPTDSPEPSSPNAEPSNPDLLIPKEGFSVSRTGSILNLTSSTLFGIYSPTAFEGSRDDSTPWGTEPNANTEALSEKEKLGLERPYPRRHGGFRGIVLPNALKSVLLFVFGVVYGTIIAHLHENHWITPVRMETANRYSWQYVVFWGSAGVALGSVLPWLDLLWEDLVGDEKVSRRPLSSRGEKNNADRPSSRWSPVVRSVGAFVGIAFALRRLPWQSTAQASLTLALVNPVLWYLVDRSKPGFILSTLVGLAGTGTVLGLNPEIVPAPTSPSTKITVPGPGEAYELEVGLSQESIAVGTWIASVLFCACVCFGNIGRQLALGGARKQFLKTE
ncbi:hypothetical protein VTN02DRAFT_1824 [Thermoascus thermophilus]